MNVCIFSLNSYNILSQDSRLTHMGGAETQVLAVARGMATRGHEITFVTLDHGQPDGVEFDGIRVFKAFRARAGVPILRSVWPRWTSVKSALSRADPDVCVQACADTWTGLVASWCRKAKRRFVFVVMSDADCDATLPLLATRRERALFRYGIRRADQVVAQTQIQREMLQKNFGVDSILVRPCSDIPKNDLEAPPLTPSPPHGLLWIGRFVPYKRLEWFLDIAEACPDLVCYVVGGSNRPTEYARNVESRAHESPNVTMHGVVPHKEMGKIYRRAALLVSTSRFEGFPTIFMEAWARGIPTITTCDPDGVVAKYGLGRAVGDVKTLIAGIRDCLATPEKWRNVSQNARRYYLQNHTVDRGAEAFERVLMEAARNNTPSDQQRGPT